MGGRDDDGNDCFECASPFRVPPHDLVHILTRKGCITPLECREYIQEDTAEIGMLALLYAKQ